MEKELQVSIRMVKIKEIKFLDMMKLDNTNRESSSKAILKLGTDLTDQEIENLSARDGLKITQEVNELNGFTEVADFPKL